MRSKIFSQDIVDRWKLRLLFFLAIAVLAGQPSLLAGKFGEHKKIGDEAFKKFVERYQLLQFLKDTLDVGVKGDDARLFAGSTLGFTYGDLTGLSADHGVNPFNIYLDLASNRSKLSQTIRSHLEAIERGELAAEDWALTKIDWFYPLNALIDQAHFYEFGKTMDEQLEKVDAMRIEQIKNLWSDTFSEMDGTFKSLLNANALAKYAILHTIAQQCMYGAGRMLNDTLFFARRYALELFERGLLFNAFADHYLQDTFAAGHLAVKRSLWRALDNMGTHDYYCRNGLVVSNARGERWRTYGDGFINDTTYHYAILANLESLNELWAWFLRGRYEPSSSSVIAELVRAQTPRSEFFKTNYRAYSIVPIPVDENDITFANSRNGVFLAAIVARTIGSAKETIVSLRAGFGSNQQAPRQGDAGKESVLWRGYHARYDNGNTWWQLQLGSEVIVRDWISFEVNTGSRRDQGVSRWVFNPAIGVEFKPVSWSVAPSLKMSYTIISDRAPSLALQLEFRYY